MAFLKSKNPDIFVRIEKQKKFVSYSFVVLLIIQVFLFNGITNLGNTLNQSYKGMQEANEQATEDFVNGTVRGQERIMLSAIRQGWIQYLNIYPDTELIQKDGNKFIYSNPKGERMLFDPSTMSKMKVDDAYYNITDIHTGKLLATAVRPQWNIQAVKNIIDIVGSAAKAFGPTGDPIVYDAFSGEIIIDNSGNTKESPEVLQEDGRRNLKLMYLHPQALNRTQVKSVIDELMWRKDSDSSSKITSLYAEPQILDPNKVNDFSVYPFGEYRREFIEKIILPYESIGIEGQEMQIGVAIGAQEQEISSVYTRTVKAMQESQNNLQNSLEVGVIYPLGSIGISLITIFFSMFMIRLFSYQCKVCRLESKEGSDR